MFVHPTILRHLFVIKAVYTTVALFALGKLSSKHCIVSRTSYTWFSITMTQIRHKVLHANSTCF
jgi:hypothetical protein